MTINAPVDQSATLAGPAADFHWRIQQMSNRRDWMKLGLLAGGAALASAKQAHGQLCSPPIVPLAPINSTRRRTRPTTSATPNSRPRSSRHQRPADDAQVPSRAAANPLLGLWRD